MSCDFVTVYAAAIITSGEYAYVKKNGKPFWYLEAVEVNPWDGISPKNCLLDKLGHLVGFQFSTEWLRYIGTTIHNKEYAPSVECEVEKNFAVIHYWLDAECINEFSYAVKDMQEVKLVDMSENKDGIFLYTDSLAAKRVMELQNKSFNDLQKLA